VNGYEYESYRLSGVLRQRVSKRVPINGVKTMFMYGYTGEHDPVQQAKCESFIQRDIAAEV